MVLVYAIALTQVYGEGSSQTLYIVKPSDSIIEVDASRGNVEVILPAFIDYEISNVMIVKRLDASDRIVTVKSENFADTLETSESISMQGLSHCISMALGK